MPPWRRLTRSSGLGQHDVEMNVRTIVHVETPEMPPSSAEEAPKVALSLLDKAKSRTQSTIPFSRHGA